jgi:formate hydrogenlyase subunit 3/multisubunit Na+/H+ antiporter MnhD subunit
MTISKANTIAALFAAVGVMVGASSAAYGYGWVRHKGYVPSDYPILRYTTAGVMGALMVGLGGWELGRRRVAPQNKLG